MLTFKDFAVQLTERCPALAECSTFHLFTLLLCHYLGEDDTYYQGETDEGDGYGGGGASNEDDGGGDPVYEEDGDGATAYEEAEGDGGDEYQDNEYGGGEDSYDNGGEVNSEYGNNGQYNNPFLDSSENGAQEGEADAQGGNAYYDDESGYYYEYY